jgi:hypothetical protein
MRKFAQLPKMMLSGVLLVTFDPVRHAARLYERRKDAAVVPFVACPPDSEFQPTEYDCHTNVEEWCRRNPGHMPVRGWLVFDFTPIGFFRFSAHSVVRRPDGRLFDITPSRVDQRYPFLQDEMSPGDYVAVVDGLQIIWLHHHTT